VTAAELFVETLRRRGVDWISTLCGHGQDPLFHAARKAGIRFVDTRNEQTASYIADYWGRLTRRPGVCSVSSGVAHVNGLAGVMNAYFDGSPLLLISGAGDLRTAGLGHFQDIEQAGVARPITHLSRVLEHPDRAAQMLEEALDIAEAAPGPVHLTFPMDVQTSEAAAPVHAARLARAGAAGDPDQVIRELNRAERPLIVAGSGVYYAQQGEAALAFAERHSIPLVTPIWDRGSVERPSPVHMGVLGAATGGADLLGASDCVIFAGAVSDYRTRYLAPAASLTHGWDRIGAGKSFPGWLAEAGRLRDEFRARIGGTPSRAVMHALQTVMTDDTVLCVDGGSIGQWFHQTLAYDRYPARWLTCGRSGVVGWGIGGAMAARLASPDAPVILLSGDGSFTFTVADIECAVRQKLHFVAVVADDQAWGITQTGHLRQFGEPIASSLGPIDFAKLAESLGARGVALGSAAEIAPALRDAVSRDSVTVIHVPIPGGTP
jgi:acetolactate synthase-1/2/3 large subunit